MYFYFYYYFYHVYHPVIIRISQLYHTQILCQWNQDLRILINALAFLFRLGLFFMYFCFSHHAYSYYEFYLPHFTIILLRFSLLHSLHFWHVMIFTRIIHQLHPQKYWLNFQIDVATISHFSKLPSHFIEFQN